MALTFKSGTYVKGDKTRYVDTAADAVAAVFEGFALVDAEQAASHTVEDDQADLPVTPPSNDPVPGVGTLGAGDTSEDADAGASGGAASQF